VRAPGPVLVFTAAAVGLNMKAKLGDFAVEYDGFGVAIQSTESLKREVTWENLWFSESWLV
jgi:hypothetical protein